MTRRSAGLMRRTKLLHFRARKRERSFFLLKIPVRRNCQSEDDICTVVCFESMDDLKHARTRKAQSRRATTIARNDPPRAFFDRLRSTLRYPSTEIGDIEDNTTHRNSRRTVDERSLSGLHLNCKRM